MSTPIVRFCIGICIVAIALVLHRFSEDEAVSRARLEGYESGFRAFENTRLDLTSTCQRSSASTNQVVNTVAGPNG